MRHVIDSHGRSAIYGEVIKKYLPLFLACAFLMIGSACSDMFKGSDPNMRSWFTKGTGLNLPADARFVDGKNSSAWLSDIYLKLQVAPSYRKTLDEGLSPMTEAPSFTLPDNLQGWPAWDLDGKQLRFYSKTTGTVDTGGFVSHLAFEESTGTLYCHFVEYAP